jgi:hypothetical protein
MDSHVKSAPDTFLKALNRIVDKGFFEKLRYLNDQRMPLAMSSLKNALFDHLLAEGMDRNATIKLTIAQRDEVSLRIAQAVNELAPSIYALACWQLTKNIYTFRPGLAEPLKRAKLKSLPTCVIEQRPEGCTYIDHPFDTPTGQRMQGFFVYVEKAEEYDENQQDLLRFLFLPEKLEQSLAQGTLAGMFLSLPLSDDMTISECIEVSLESSRTSPVQSALSTAPEGKADYNPLVAALPLYLYLCSQDPDFGGQIPLKPIIRRTKQGIKAERPKTIHSVDMGGILFGRHYVGKGSASATGEAEETGVKVRPHMKAPHFQHYYIGPRSERKAVLKYVAAYTVGDFEEPVTTIRAVTPRR